MQPRDGKGDIERPLQESAAIIQPGSTTLGALKSESLATKADIPSFRLLMSPKREAEPTQTKLFGQQDQGLCPGHCLQTCGA